MYVQTGTESNVRVGVVGPTHLQHRYNITSILPAGPVKTLSNLNTCVSNGSLNQIST